MDVDDGDDVFVRDGIWYDCNCGLELLLLLSDDIIDNGYSYSCSLL